MYLYGRGSLPSLDDKFLYHFTSAESLLKILENMTLKMSSFENLNDLNEKEVNFILNDWLKGLKINKYISEQCQVISFSQNYQKKEKFCECGCNHPRMWAQYADKNKGACVVINEKKFIEINKTILNEIFWKIENVSYNPYIYKENLTDSANPKEFLENNYKEIFFEKHSDWEQEDERRLFCIGGPKFFSIDNCIEFICLGNKFEINSYNQLSDVLIDSIDKDFIKLIPHDFTFQINADGRCLCADNAFRIVDYVMEKGENALKYKRYLNENGYSIK
jgi:hypothetical protein